MKEKLEKLIKDALVKVGAPIVGFNVDHTDDLRNGDYYTNAALKVIGPISHGNLKTSTGKKGSRVMYQEGRTHFDNPLDLAGKLVEALGKIDGVAEIKIAGPGFINFYLSKEFFKSSLKEIIEKGDEFGKGGHAKGFKVMVEHTDPNPFKEFHIGHLMPNVIGSTVARICEWNGAEVKQANWQGDVGMHIAKSVWAITKGEASILPLGKAYVIGSKAYEEDVEAKQEIEDINRKIYDKSDKEINKVYEEGRRVSLDYFESVYKRLDTKFDYYFFEGKEGVEGKEIVEAHVKDGIFEESEGAIVFHGEKYGLHTRVFINSKGQPTYEAKELGLNKKKFEVEPDLGLSLIVTGNEIKDYFKVLMKVISLIFPNIAEKTKHLPHGMLRLPTGKMSSRTGDVITAEELIEEVRGKVKGDERVAIAAIKYMILRQSIGNDIIFDLDKSVSTEGDSGVYLQYAHARANSILEKAGKGGNTDGESGETREIEKLLYRFPEIVERAGAEYAPNYITTYLTELASSFNNFYVHEKVLEDSPQAPYRLAIVEAFKNVMKNGLNILGIPAPEKM